MGGDTGTKGFPKIVLPIRVLLGAPSKEKRIADAEAQ
jgi:hypothetical protein